MLPGEGEGGERPPISILSLLLLLLAYMVVFCVERHSE